ncbi:NAD-dependent epimerase/dehydratase family protein [Jeotgalibaca caeni]|uniref:NAD-dependent epimerase/dehydratase family protein n=1 Tax=Jeotgalibaca caeni TaxID=3028623 RepID=UPI00237D390D|nr:NAD-dependent epimerase/dehydratase family protein [Jeotgalibaca caeni]MDE1549933.1 GDP-mannose 4,6-dehydratase [Jeotgalibaca caeni]
MQSKSILVTGAAGFVGYYLSERLLQEGHTVVGIDNLNDYYDVNLKHERLNKMKNHSAFTFLKIDLADKAGIDELFATHNFDMVVNLAAQAGVRYSIENPDAYIQSNIIGFHNILEACRHYPVEHLLYASSSSVYGSNKKVPFEETDFVDNPVSLYAATKKSNELMAHTYSHLYKIPATGLRFFTVYGPMGRPDMAYFGFTDKFFNDEPIHIFNNGDFENDLYRDFTYIDDIITGIMGLIEKPASGHTVFNIGNNNPEKLMVFITSLERALSNSLGREVEFEKIFEPIKPGDVPATYASTDKLQEAIGFKPETSIQDGLQRFTDWYVSYYNKK